jgi:NADH:ubiquinone oxidoreductase subunit C
MTLHEIHARLRERFGDAIHDWQAPDAGSVGAESFRTYIQVAPESLHDVCAALRDEDGFRFDFLRLISSVDRVECLSSVYHLSLTPIITRRCSAWTLIVRTRVSRQ